MNKSELIAAVAAKTGFTKKDAEKAVNAIIDCITAALKKGKKVQLIGFGTFEVRNRAAKQGHNPKTGAPMMIPASKLPAFKAGKTLKDAVR
ncbi:MAG: HU family DNA-binding protein [Ruminococcaceae bacterium]|nr:HU family DNA-binding protein [Oscillospiraceae bacterium]